MLYTEDVCGAAELLIWSHFFPLITHQHGPTPESLLTTLTNVELPQFAERLIYLFPTQSVAGRKFWILLREAEFLAALAALYLTLVSH